MSLDNKFPKNEEALPPKSEFYPPLERIERKLDAIIDWINWFAKENSFKGEYGGFFGINGKFTTLPTIDIEDCEKRDKDSE